MEPSQHLVFHSTFASPHDATATIEAGNAAAIDELCFSPSSVFGYKLPDDKDLWVRVGSSLVTFRTPPTARGGRGR